MFKIQVKKRNGETIWTRQWPEPPTDEVLEALILDDRPSFGGLFKHGYDAYRAIIMMRNDPTIISVEMPGIDVYKENV